MLDVLNWARERAAPNATQTLEKLGVKHGEYLLATIHRSENTDSATRLGAIVKAFNALDETVLFPVHPRTRKAIAAAGEQLAPHVHTVDPVGYLEMVTASAGARLVLTDSGGLQKEAYWLGVPCVTCATKPSGWKPSTPAGTRSPARTANRSCTQVRNFSPPSTRAALYGDGRCAARCVTLLQ